MDMHDLNVYPETSREYTHDFSIVKRQDWATTSFGKSNGLYLFYLSIKSCTCEFSFACIVSTMEK
jgi:hypothetical protein